ncbi:MAG: hypothetical protein PHQ43_08220 [Dehalococcoidales bacterium]|nr:hypothetical protein [Dehalococcoidales bacterium]
MSWSDEQWGEWGAALGWYKSGEAIDGRAQCLSMDVQLKHGVGAIFEGSVDLIEPWDAGAEDETWRADINLPRYLERWEGKKGSKIIRSTYLEPSPEGFHAADAGEIVADQAFEKLENFAKFACEYLHEIDVKTAYAAWREAMLHY